MRTRKIEVVFPLALGSGARGARVGLSPQAFRYGLKILDDSGRILDSFDLAAGAVKKIPASTLAELDRIDEQRAALDLLRRQLLNGALAEGAPVTRADFE